MGNAHAASLSNPFGCCLVHPKTHEVDFLKTAANKVDLAASVLGGLPGLMAYHTSIVVNGEELFFSPMGILRNHGLDSHRRADANGAPLPQLPNADSTAVLKVREMGSSALSGDSVYQALAPIFLPGSYDLLHKNCNHFTDVALAFLLGQRLPSTYNSLEKVGANNPRLLEQVTGGAYVPNPRAVEFNVEEAVRHLCEAVGRLSTGTVARVTGLVSETAKQLNNKACVVQRYNSTSARYEVRIDGETKALRPENLEPFQLHQDLVVADLRSAAAEHLNGERCRVHKFNPQTGRLEVRLLSSGDIKALRMENVRAL